MYNLEDLGSLLLLGIHPNLAVQLIWSSSALYVARALVKRSYSFTGSADVDDYYF